MEGAALEGEEENQQRSKADEKEAIQILFEVLEAIGAYGDYKKTQKKECFNLVRRMKLLSPLLEEVRENECRLSTRSISCFNDLKKAFLCAKKLLKTCNNGSKIYLVRRFFPYLLSLSILCMNLFTEYFSLLSPISGIGERGDCGDVPCSV